MALEHRLLDARIGQGDAAFGPLRRLLRPAARRRLGPAGDLAIAGLGEGAHLLGGGVAGSNT